MFKFLPSDSAFFYLYLPFRAIVTRHRQNLKKMAKIIVVRMSIFVYSSNYFTFKASY